MAKNFKDMTAEEQEEYITTLQAKAAIGDKAEDYKNQLEAEKEKTKEIENLKKEKDTAVSTAYKMTLDKRMEELSKYVQSKKGDASLIEKIGGMSQDDYDLFKDGKTDDIYRNNDDLKKETEDMQTKIDEAKQKAIEEYSKKHGASKSIEDNPDLVPPTEAGKVANENGKEKETIGGTFPTIETVEEMYRLKKMPEYHNMATYKERAKVSLGEILEHPFNTK